VFFALIDDYPDADLRHYTFMLEGLKEKKQQLASRGIQNDKNINGTKMETNNFSVEDLGESVVLNDRNEHVKLSTLWQVKSAVLVFVRHFG